MRVVSNFVRQIAQLGFQAGLGARQKALPHPARLQLLQHLSVDGRAMLEDALTGLKTQVQAVKLGVALLQRIDHAQALQVVLKTAERLHAGIQRILPRVAKRCVAQVMCQRDGLYQVLIERQRTRHGAPQLRHFQRVRQPGAEQVALVVEKNLRFIHQPAKRRAVHDAVAVALKLGARGRWRLGKAPATRKVGVAGVGGQGHIRRNRPQSLHAPAHPAPLSPLPGPDH